MKYFPHNLDPGKTKAPVKTKVRNKLETNNKTVNSKSDVFQLKKLQLI